MTRAGRLHPIHQHPGQHFTHRRASHHPKPARHPARTSPAPSIAAKYSTTECASRSGASSHGTRTTIVAAIVRTESSTDRATLESGPTRRRHRLDRPSGRAPACTLDLHPRESGSRARERAIAKPNPPDRTDFAHTGHRTPFPSSPQAGSTRRPSGNPPLRGPAPFRMFRCCRCCYLPTPAGAIQAGRE